MSNPLTDQQKDEICGVIRVGCDRQTAAKYARTTWAELHAAMSADAAFAARLRHEEAVVEIRHMTQLREASKKEANWRVCVWWLERLYPDRYGPRGAGEVNSRQLKKFIEHLGDKLVMDVHNDTDRERLLDSLQTTAHTLELFLRDEFPSEEPLSLELTVSDVDPAIDSLATPSDEPHSEDEDST